MPRRRPAADGSPAAASMATIARAAEAAVRNAGPGLERRMKWGHPWFAGRDLVCLVGPFERHVGVEFWRGAALAPDHPLLEGTGKNLRHVKLRTLEDAASAEFATLVRDAIRLDRTEVPRAR